MNHPDLRDFTLGVEEEYQLIDPETGELRNRASAVLESDWSGEIREEMQQTTVEVGTRVCTSAKDLHGELARLRMQAAVAAESRGLRVVAAGLHPFSHWGKQEFTRNEVYDQIRREYRRLADSEYLRATCARRRSCGTRSSRADECAAALPPSCAGALRQLPDVSG
jgi:carboxylate-amine ligase